MGIVPDQFESILSIHTFGFPADKINDSEVYLFFWRKSFTWTARVLASWLTKIILTGCCV
jgi:hypothetical protein